MGEDARRGSGAVGDRLMIEPTDEEDIGPNEPIASQTDLPPGASPSRAAPRVWVVCAGM
jgi:hypothetical protein